MSIGHLLGLRSEVGTVSKLLRLRNGRLPPSVNELGNLDPSRSSPEGHNQIRVSTPASFRRIGQRSSSRPVSPLPECPAPPQGIALRSLGAARAVACALGRCAWASVTLFHLLVLLDVHRSLCSNHDAFCLSDAMLASIICAVSAVCCLSLSACFSILAAQLLRVAACPSAARHSSSSPVIARLRSPQLFIISKLIMSCYGTRNKLLVAT